MEYREEKDYLGTMNIPSEFYSGIHTARAVDNFPVSGYKIHSEFIKAFGAVKLACAKTINDLNVWEKGKAEAIFQACLEMSEGKLNEYIIVDAMQGGAGTSLNMNVNEVIANRALEIAGRQKGDYSYIDPIEDINKFQSTNDVYPTALKIACIKLLRELETQINSLQEAFQAKEKEFADIVKIGRTQLMDAVLVTLGKEFSAYAEAISRDRWRVYKCEERLRVVNIGGTAVGTGLGAPRKYIFGVIENLREITGIGLARAENMIENTQNTDVFAEVSGILKAHAANLIKISNDLRLMNSGPNAGYSEITLPAVQVGSSIMAGKVNPVIAEMTAQSGIKVFGNDVIINQCTASGQFELNQFLPLIAFSMLETLEILINTNKIFTEKCITGIQANIDNINKHIDSSQATITALIQKLGYKNTQKIISGFLSSGKALKNYIVNNNFLTEEEYNFLISPESVLSLGYKD
jgi:aspartate ammonia-lyase